MNAIPLLVAALGFLAASPCSAQSKTSVAVSLPPYAWLAEQIGGDAIEVISLLEEGEDPHAFQPPPRRITALANAKVWFTTGMPFEKPLAEKLAETAPRLVIVPVQEGIKLEGWGEHDHDHDHDHAHGKKEGKDDEDHDAHDDHGEYDPHIWLSPVLLKQQAHTISHALGELDPGRAEEFENRAVALEEKLDQLHASLTEVLAPLKGSTIYVFHPAFGYFARTYGMTQEAIETGGREPSAKHLTELIEHAREEGVKIILVQPQFSQASAEKMAKAIGATVVPVNPLQKDILATLRTLAEAVQASR